MRSPDLSVLLCVLGSPQRALRTVEYLRGQTVRERIEIVLITSSTNGLALDEEIATDFCGVRVVDAGVLESRAQAMAEGVRQAGAPLVAFGGNHSYPSEDWAEQLIDAHRSGWAGVAPAELNANPATMVSWSHFFMGHGRWVHPIAAGVIDAMPSASGVYRRDLLLACEPDLGDKLERDGGISKVLQSKGHQLFLEPAARVRHYNVSLLRSLVRVRYHVGREFGASRVRRERWSRPRRLLYILGLPLIPILQLRLVLGWIRRCDREYQLLPRILPTLSVGVIAHAIGEVFGYAFGPGNARQQILAFEADIERHMTEPDQQLRARELCPGGVGRRA